MSSLRTPLICFDDFELDAAAVQLRRAGATVKLQPQPFEVLMLLASKPGEVISRQEIQRRVWGDDTHVDFEGGLGYCMKRRIQSTSNRKVKLVHSVRTAERRASLKNYRGILRMLRTDSQFRAFHEGRSDVLPEFYHQKYERMLDQYAELLGRADRIPVLEGAA